MTISEKLKKIFRRSFRILLTTVLVIFGILVLILILIQTRPVQNFGRKKIEAWLEGKLHTKVRIGNLYIGIPSKVILKNIYLEDRQRDTLIAGGNIEVDISMLSLLHHELRVSNIELADLTIKVKRLMPDTVFNFQFIPDAFASTEKTVENPNDSSAGFQFILGALHLHHVRAVYHDDATGNDVQINLGDFKTRLKTFDPAGQIYNIPEISLAELSGNVRQYNPILILRKAADTISAHNQASVPVQVKLGHIGFSGIALGYKNEVDKLDAGLRLGSLEIQTDSIDLGSIRVGLKKVALANTFVSLHVGKKIRTKPEKNQADTIARNGSWGFDLADFKITNARFQYDDDNERPVRSGIDYNHLDVNKLDIDASGLHADPAAYHGNIRNISLEEKNGLILKQLAAQVAYDGNGASLKGLVIQTGHSSIHSQLVVRYPSISAFTKNPGLVQTDLLFDHAQIAVQDLLIFAPALSGRLKGQERAVLQLNGKVNGPVKDLRIPYLQISGIGTTSVAAAGSIRGLPDGNKAFYDIKFPRLTTTKTDLQRIIPSSSMPQYIRIPENISASGKFTGTIRRFNVDLHATTSNGRADLTGMLDLNNQAYDLAAKTQSLDLGYILKQDSLLGTLTLSATAKGSGFDPKKMNSTFHAELGEAEFKSYAYRGLLLDARLNQGSGTISSSMKDPNIAYVLQGEGKFTGKNPSARIRLELDTINFRALHLMNDSLGLSLLLNADFPSLDPDALQGKLDMDSIAFSHGGTRLYTDSLRLAANHSDTAQQIMLRSEAADLDWNGKYKLTQTADAIKQLISHYYQLAGKQDTAQVDPQDWKISLTLHPSPMILNWMPALRGTDTVKGNIYFNSVEKKLNLQVNAPQIQYGDQVIHQLNIQADTRNDALYYAITANDAGRRGFQLHKTSFAGKLQDDKFFTTLTLQDAKNKDRYRLSGVVSQVIQGIRFAFMTDSLLLNYDAWNTPADNYIQYDSSGLLVHNLKLEHQVQALTVNSNGNNGHAPMAIDFSNFQIRTLTHFADQDSLLMDGTVNGRAEIRDLLSKPLFTSDLKIDNLAYKLDTIGNVLVQVNNEELNAYAAHIKLSGRDNDLQVDEKYYPGEGKMDLDMKLNQLNLASFKSFAASQIKDMHGFLKGSLHVSGSPEQPVLRGSLHFDSAVITPVITGEPLRLSNDEIGFDDDGFNFSEFTMLDSAGNKAILDGNVFTKDFRKYKFDMTFSAANFRVVNAPKEPNRVFYGKLNVSAAIDVTGDQSLPKVNAHIRVNKNTDFTVILPSEDPEVVDRQGVVVFTDNKQKTDSAQFKHFLDSLSTHTELKGMDLSTDIETDSNAQFTLVIDERNGDALAMRGRADLSGGVDKSGKTTLTGSYELDNGSYNLTLSLLHRKFMIQRGSTVTWNGKVTDADVNITAVYIVNTAAIDLVEQQLAGRSTDEVNRFKQRLPFRVELQMTGKLLQPQIKFGISLPENLLAQWPEVDLKLQQMRSDEAEVNKQVFALLLLGRFVNENPFESAGGGSTAETVARQSASRILSDQLNQLAGSLIKGVDVNFDLNSSEDYTTGTMQNQTDLTVSVSKSLFNDRVRVSVGSDFQLEETNPNQNASTIAGDVDLDYKLSKDGRYMIRVYRKDQYESVVEGQVVETGLSFILTFDYDKLRELFENEKKEELKVPKPKKSNSKKK